MKQVVRKAISKSLENTIIGSFFALGKAGGLCFGILLGLFFFLLLGPFAPPL